MRRRLLGRHPVLGRGWGRCTASTLGASVAIACGDGTGPGSGGLEIVAGGNLVDTALARPAQALVVRVKGAGSGVQVIFEGTDSPLGGQYVSVSSIRGSSFDQQLADTTDQRGQAAARLWFASKAGEHFVRIRVPSRNLIDSVRLTVRPAGLFNLAADPSHSTVILGSNRTIQVGTGDAYGNQWTGDPITLRPLDDVTTTSGTVVRGAKLGRSTIEVSAGSLKGNIYVTVAPAVDLAGITNRGVARVRADGANLRLIIPVTLPSLFVPSRSSWVRDGSAVVFDAYGILYWARRDSTSRPLTDGVEAATSPTVTADGRWIYYARQTQGTWRIHRIKPDATGDELVLGGVEPLTWPTISPDGQYLAFVAGGQKLRILTLLTGGVSSVHETATTPTWAPDGSELAFVCGDRLCVVRPDGSALRFVGDLDRYGAGLEWSPDGRWLFASNFAAMLVDVTTGLDIPLFQSLQIGAATWAR